MTSTIISIQSQVVHGHVGNSAAVFPMQAMGHVVAAVPTALLSNHPHYPTMHGQVLGADLLRGLLLGVEERGLMDSAGAVVSGYLGSVDNGEVVADFVARARQRNPRLLYVCDPVMGDDDLGIFVQSGLIELFRQRLAPLASIITPNRYELELLAQRMVRSAQDVAEAMAALAARGTGAGMVTGCVLDDTMPGTVETLAWTPDRLSRSAIARLPIRPCGTGDLITALMLGRLLRGQDLHQASHRATREILAVLERTRKQGAAEMCLAGFPFGIDTEPA
ncbi:MAG: pyridoxal kinase [Pelagibacterium sp. SCN 63-23]|nr:MAG: pyridoxal kinase [Pelagibacterium sp. SCN 63-23]